MGHGASDIWKTGQEIFGDWWNASEGETYFNKLHLDF
jgi:hypothetical protein